MSPANPARADSPTSAGFHTTHWTVVLKARGEDGTAAREALASLCAAYWIPLEYTTAGKQELFAALQGFHPGGHGETCRAELAAKRSVSVGAIDVAVHRLRQRFGALLPQQVAQTVFAESEIEEEIRHLIAMLNG